MGGAGAVSEEAPVWVLVSRPGHRLMRHPPPGEGTENSVREGVCKVSRKALKVVRSRYTSWRVLHASMWPYSKAPCMSLGHWPWICLRLVSGPPRAVF
jgi:hypothetical protein